MKPILLVLVLLSLTANAQTDAPFTLVCHYGTGQQTYLTVKVDPANKTANGLIADIGDTEIRWLSKTGENQTWFFVDRYSGQIRVSTTASPTATTHEMTGACVKASDRKF
jgi:hypothetical protein